jgi:hypothetical protein
MRLDPEIRRRSLLPLLAAALTAAYLFGFLPLDRKADDLDAPLRTSWRRLAASLGPTNVVRLDFVSLTNQFVETRAALAVFETARKQAQARVELDEALRGLLSAPFLLVQYDYAAERQRGTLTRLAKQQGVALDPGVFAGFPHQTADMTEPALLWAELAFLDGLLTTAINAKVATIHSVGAPLPLNNPPPPITSRPFAELPVQIELTGPIPNVARFLQTLPLRAGEIKAAGLPEAPTNKPALFIDRLVLRKQSPDKPDEVRLSLRAVGFVLRE